MNITPNIKNNKPTLLRYFRNKAAEFLKKVNDAYGNSDYKKKAKAINGLIVKSRLALIKAIEEKAEQENWTNRDLLEAILMVTYCNYVVLLEVRHRIWAYEYMAFSRRIGELWEPFCKLAFKYPINNLQLFVPPNFAEVKQSLSNEIEAYVRGLRLEGKEKEQLLKYYEKVWSFTLSGEIQLALDLHFVYQGKKYVVDFKSGFGSNEKGNTNRLLLVASVYRSLAEEYQPLIFVRSAENNNYFNTLKNSGLWQAFSGEETYRELYRYTGFDIKTWINQHVNWTKDLNPDFVQDLETNNLTQYLNW